MAIYMTSAKILVIAVNIIYIVIKVSEIYNIMNHYLTYLEHNEKSTWSFREENKVEIADNLFSMFVSIASIVLVLSNLIWTFIIIAFIGALVSLHISIKK